MNPPFNDPLRQNVSPDPQRRLAHVAAADTLTHWVRRAEWLLTGSGVLTVIWRADGLGDVLSALSESFGGIDVLPVYPRPGAAAIRPHFGLVAGRAQAIFASLSTASRW
jgi:tRNA1(Val) A37 N6-methylase TrmN6